MDNNGFFIGWQEKLHPSYKSMIRKLLVAFISVALLVIVLFVTNQSRFNNHFFKLGKINEVVGVYQNSPVPILNVSDNSLDPGISKDLLLVGYGKAGAEGIMKSIQDDLGDLNGKTIKLQGSLIYGDGKTVLELTKKENSVLELINNEVVNESPEIQKSMLELSGEIIDPKCYFGVMKPGEGKIHKSCAIRCISGGIPPVFKVSGSSKNEFYIILGQDGSKINKNVLEYIAEPVMIKGNTYEMHGWKVIEINPSDITIIQS